MAKGVDLTLAGSFNDPVRKLKKLREQRDILNQHLAELTEKIHIIEHEIMETHQQVPSDVVRCCGMCQPFCQERCGCRHQCLIEQEKKVVVVSDEPPVKRQFDPERDWPRKL